MGVVKGCGELVLAGSLLFSSCVSVPIRKTSADVARDMNERCYASGLEEAVVFIPSTGEEFTMTENATKESVYFNGAKLDEFFHKYSSLELFHCHPFNSIDAELKQYEGSVLYELMKRSKHGLVYFGQQVPSQTDVSFMFINAGIFYLFHPDGKIRFFIVRVKEKPDGAWSTLEYAPKDDNKMRSYGEKFQHDLSKNPIIGQEIYNAFSEKILLNAQERTEVFSFQRNAYERLNPVDKDEQFYPEDFMHVMNCISDIQMYAHRGTVRDAHYDEDCSDIKK